MEYLSCSAEYVHLVHSAHGLCLCCWTSKLTMYSRHSRISVDCIVF